MNPHLTQQLVSQHEAGQRRLAASSGHSSKAEQARHAPGRQGRRPHPVRRQAGWALISLGIRLAYTAGEE
jgi:hypothetical protein